MVVPKLDLCARMNLLFLGGKMIYKTLDTAVLTIDELLTIIDSKYAAAKTIGRGAWKLLHWNYCRKIRCVLESNQNWGKWLKTAYAFDSDSPRFKDTVSQVIQFFDQRNTEQLENAYANVVRAYQNHHIDENSYFRLGYVLMMMYGPDVEYIKANIDKDLIKANDFCDTLSAAGLMRVQTGMVANEDEMYDTFYEFTNLAKMLDKYALSYGEDKYCKEYSKIR